MAPRSGPSIAAIVLSLAGIAVGGTLTLFGISAAVGLMSDAPAVQVPAQTVAIKAASAVSVAATSATAARASTPPVQSKPAVPPRQAAPARTASAAARPRKARPTPKAHVAAVPDRLKSLGNARQVVVVTSANKADRDGTLTLYNLGTDGDWTRIMSAPTRLGRNGLVAGSARHQGSSMTPTGSWSMPTWGFGKAAAAPRGSRLGWRQIKSTTYWTSAQGSTYNTWVSSSSGVPGEHLADNAGASYEFAIDSGYNAPPNPSVYGRGTAIFIHVMHPGYTAGCISIPREKMIELLKKLDPARHPRCVIGTTDRGTSTSVYAY